MVVRRSAGRKYLEGSAPERCAPKELESIAKRLAESGLLDGLAEATGDEADIIVDNYHVWTLRLAPYMLENRAVTVAQALALYIRDHRAASVKNA